jgi:hypothetical protein
VSWAIAEFVTRRLYENLEQTAVNAFGSVRQRVAAHLPILPDRSTSGLFLSVMRPQRDWCAVANLRTATDSSPCM